MDFQKTERPLDNSTVYVLMERFPHEEPTILAMFATYEAAKIAADIYEQRKNNFRYYYEIEPWEVLDQATISEGQRQKTTAVGEGSDPSNLPATGAG